MVTNLSSSQVIALETIRALTEVTAMSIVVTGLSAGLLASGVFKVAKVVKKKEGLTWVKPKK